jgi:hypothetical protein
MRPTGYWITVHRRVLLASLLAPGTPVVADRRQAQLKPLGMLFHYVIQVSDSLCNRYHCSNSRADKGMVCALSLRFLVPKRLHGNSSD